MLCSTLKQREIEWKNKMNWNILVILGKEIKRDSIINVNENRKVY